ncbi:MAG TPA: hypothetical protein VFH06_04295 [Candidatus Saccharimonadales bacterium]|nr:hypothetical protein [Candidatus Saccharimonadales bacterium]
MARKMNEVFLARRVDIVLGGVPAVVEIHFDDALADGLVRVCAEIPRLRGVGVSISCSCKDNLLKVAVTGRSSGIQVKNTGNATVSGGGVANTGVMLGDAVPSGEFAAANAPAVGNYDGVAKGWLGVHHDMMPKVTLRLYYGSKEPLLYRVTG